MVRRRAVLSRSPTPRRRQKSRRPQAVLTMHQGILLGVLLLSSQGIQGQSIIKADDGMSIEDSQSLECHRRQYTYKVVQKDENGKQCWDNLSVMACWGRCDSNEISDWRFPWKKSNHPVCIHYGRKRNFVLLRHCEEGANPTVARYEYLEAAACRCQQCSSSDTSCEGVRYRPQRSQPDAMGFSLY